MYYGLCVLINGIHRRISTYVLRDRSYLFTGLYDTTPSLQLLLNDCVVQQSMFDEYYVVLCGTYRSTGTNACDHNNKYTYFIIALSFARPPSLLLLLFSVSMGVILCFEVMNTVQV